MSETSPDVGSGSDKYRTLFELGQGGTANVSLAVARGPDGFRKLFVVKRLRAAYAQDPDLREMFMTEARLSARLNHPHVVQVYEVFEHDGTPTIAMEYIEGQTLDTVLSLDDRLSLDLHLRVLADVLSGLHYSHELLDMKHQPLNVVHRDISPHNVMLSYEGVVKVLDFGIAKLSGTTIETETGVIKGKLRYMPPEQVAGEEVDRRADVFAVGVMLWEALSGSKLWKNLPDATIMNRVLAGDIPPPHNPNVEIPAELMAICQRALAPLRQERYQTALELEQAIEDYLAKSSHYATARELGRFMSERFALERSGIQQRIENELGRGESAHGSGGLSTLRQSTPTRTAYTASRSLPSEPPRSRLWMWAVGCVALGVFILFWGLREQPAQPALTAVPPAVSAPAPSVAISIEARPAEAAITIDGVQVPNPYVAQRPRDKSRHRLRVSAPGFAPDEAELVFDTDVRIFRALSTAPAAVPSTGTTLVAPAAASRPSPMARGSTAPISPSVVSAPGSASAPAASAPVESAPAAPPACDPPFFLDARGIKKFKPECI